MTLSNNTFEEEKDFNVFQIVALNLVTTLAILSAGMALGTTWWIAMFVAWIAGGMATFLIAIAFSFFRMQASDRNALAKEVFGPANAPGNLSDPVKLWEADRLIDMAHSATAASEGDRWGARCKSSGSNQTAHDNTDDIEPVYRKKRATR